ncbi:MAG: hypothetical protein H0X37_23110 [Herpetosiphonaceae bacterium]|nr:hypothetical protein [Herpetosiphonaceae bacterium]
MTTGLPTVTITTDGSARGNPGPGGWAAILETSEGRERLISGQEPTQTTNNAMEVAAVVGALQLLKQRCHVVLRTDSEYVLNGLRRILKGGTMAQTKFNAERWAQLEEAIRRHEIEPEWVQAHHGDPRNERVDQAANAAANAAAAELRTAEADSEAGDAWLIVLRSSAAGRVAHWLLRTAAQTSNGQIEQRDQTELTNLYQALLAALRTAHGLEGSAGATILVQASQETLIKQGRGEWKVKQPAQQLLAAEVAKLRSAFASLAFRYLPGTAIDALFREGVHASAS